jgi:hypothetical protein
MDGRKASWVRSVVGIHVPEPDPTDWLAAQLIDPGELPMVSDTMTDDEQQALRLIEEILAEQQMLLSGQNFVYHAGGRRDPFRSLLLLRQRELAAPLPSRRLR